MKDSTSYFLLETVECGDKERWRASVNSHSNFLLSKLQLVAVVGRENISRKFCAFLLVALVKHDFWLDLNIGTRITGVEKRGTESRLTCYKCRRCCLRFASAELVNIFFSIDNHLKHEESFKMHTNMSILTIGEQRYSTERWQKSKKMVNLTKKLENSISRVSPRQIFRSISTFFTLFETFQTI